MVEVWREEGSDEVMGSIKMRRGLRYYPRLPERCMHLLYGSSDLARLELTPLTVTGIHLHS